MCVESNLHPCNETDLVMVYNLNVALNLVYKDFIENSLSMFLRGISLQLFVIFISGFAELGFQMVVSCRVGARAEARFPAEQSPASVRRLTTISVSPSAACPFTYLPLLTKL